MYISSKVLASTLTSLFVMIISVLITHAGLSMTAADSALITGFSTVAAGAVAGWYKKETDPAALVAAGETLTLERRVAQLESQQKVA